MSPWMIVDIHYQISWIEITVLNGDTNETQKIRLSGDDIAKMGKEAK